MSTNSKYIRTITTEEAATLLGQSVIDQAKTFIPIIQFQLNTKTSKIRVVYESGEFFQWRARYNRWEYVNIDQAMHDAYCKKLDRVAEQNRLERLTALVRKVWPNAHIDYEPGHDLEVWSPAENGWRIEHIAMHHHPRVLDMLEAALVAGIT